MEPRRRPAWAWRILGGLFLLLILFVGGLWVWINAIADRRWDSAEQRMGELSRKFPGSPKNPPKLADIQPSNEAERAFLEVLLEAERRYPRLYPTHALVRWEQNQE